MPITFGCGCGKSLKVADEHAGKRVKCPACNGVATVPSAAALAPSVPPRPAVAKALPVPAAPVKPPPKTDDDFEIVDDDEPPRKKRSSRRDDDDEDDDRPSRRRSSRASDEDDDEDAAPRRKKKYADDDEDDDRPRKRAKKRKKKAASGGSGGKRMLYLFGGIALAIVGGAITYFVWTSDANGRGVGKAIGFGIVLILSGIGAAINGLTGNVGDEDAGGDDDDD